MRLDGTARSLGHDIAGADATLDDVERRAHARRSLHATSVLFFGPDGRSVDCAIRNIAPGGARVRLAQVVDLPQAVQLNVGPGVYLSGLVRWRIGSEVGLEFIG